MDLKRSAFKMSGLLRLTDGRQFRGMVNVNNVLRTQSDIADYLLQVNENSFVQPGMATVYQGRIFVLGRGVDEFCREALFRTLRMIEATDTLSWTRNVTTTDALTGLANTTSVSGLGQAYVSLMPSHTISDSFHVNNSKFALVTNAAVEVDDRVGPYMITFVETRHGLQYAEAK